ncbi:hypothetical protein Pelo_18785 [Pelomyxa schiedti]|nr:hypothetical protein Pelo_18785 [Pelomyxa schiedti]
MWWLGTTPDPGRSPDAHTPEYVNPHGSGLVVASWSSTCEGEPQKVLDRDCNGYNCTNAWGRAMNWWQVDLRPCGGSVCPSKSWDLLGSNDGATWTTIKRHANDQALDAPLAVGSWDLPASTAATTPPSSPSSSFSVFRLAMTGPSASGWNCNGNDYLMIAGFEIYGLLTITTNP